MNQPNLPPDETTHSFVVRLWQAAPGQWRGTIRHVQSDDRLAFLQLDQAMRWIERYVATDQVVAQPRVEPSRPRLTTRLTTHLTRRLAGWWATQPRFMTTGLALAGGVALLVLVVTLAPAAPASLAGAAIETSSGNNGLGPFLLGVVVGGGLVAFWWRMIAKR